RHLQLRDLTDLLARDATNLVAIRSRGAAIDTSSFLEQNRGGRCLRDEGEAAVGVHGDLDRNDHSRLTLRARVELLAELHDVDAVLTQRRTNRWRGVRCAGRNLQLDETSYFLCHISLVRCERECECEDLPR